MQILTDACLALLAAIGIWALGRMALDWLLDSGEESEIFFLLRARGNGRGPEHTVYKLLRSRHGSGVFLVDCGLNERGHAQLKALAEREQSVCFCRPDELANLVKEADTWMKRGDKRK